MGGRGRCGGAAKLMKPLGELNRYALQHPTVAAVIAAVAGPDCDWHADRWIGVLIANHRKCFIVRKSLACRGLLAESW